VTWRGLLTLGIAGGILPCPSALVVMLAAISLGQVLFGMLLIVAFSLGLAGVLVAIGLTLVLGRRLSGRVGANRIVVSPAAARIGRALPVLSAVAVTLAGVAITYQAWNQPGL
jgi:ABC-type nickel/cobalt efflux system permease component RcnA